MQLTDSSSSANSPEPTDFLNSPPPPSRHVGRRSFLRGLGLGAAMLSRPPLFLLRAARHSAAFAVNQVPPTAILRSCNSRPPPS
jgi:hypothetical protein